MFSRKKTGREMSFLQHLEELRWAILKSVLAILVGMIACFSFHEYIVEFLISPTLLEGLKIEIEMQAIRPAGMFTTIVNISLVGGFALALPYVLYQLWSFVSPGLMDKEKKYVPIVIFFSCVLFLVGAAFAFYILIPVMVRFFIQLYVPGIRAQWDIGFWIGLVNKMVLIMGVVFQMPIVVAFLTWLRILSADKLLRVWRIALVVIFIVAAIITPTGDPYTQTLVAIPLVVLYFISMGIAMLIGRSRRKAEADEDGDGDDDSDGEDGGDSDEEQPALTTEEPDTPTLPRDSSTASEVRVPVAHTGPKVRNTSTTTMPRWVSRRSRRRSGIQTNRTRLKRRLIPKRRLILARLLMMLMRTINHRKTQRIPPTIIRNRKKKTKPKRRVIQKRVRIIQKARKTMLTIDRKRAKTKFNITGNAITACTGTVP